jgi:hypothetical protein
MRTKTLALTVAFIVAGMASSMAQAYSVNTFGYIKLTMVPGFNLVANQLNRLPASNSLNNVIIGVPVESQVLKFANNNYQVELFDGTAWIKPDGAPGTLTTNPGDGFFFFNPNPTNLTVTLVGDVPQRNLTQCFPPGFSLVSINVPQAIPLSEENQFPQVLELQIIFWDPVTQTYKPSVFNDGSGWILPDGTPVSAPTPAVGAGFFIFNPNFTTYICWTRIFTVN